MGDSDIAAGVLFDAAVIECSGGGVILKVKSRFEGESVVPLFHIGGFCSPYVLIVFHRRFGGGYGHEYVVAGDDTCLLPGLFDIVLCLQLDIVSRGFVLVVMLFVERPHERYISFG